MSFRSLLGLRCYTTCAQKSPKLSFPVLSLKPLETKKFFFEHNIIGSGGDTPTGNACSFLRQTVFATKTYFQLPDKRLCETVLMVYPDGKKTLSLSSQVGCAHTCSFCVGGTVGFTRNLRHDELLSQVLHFQNLGHSIDQVTFHGMGEPLDNPNTFDAIAALSGKTKSNITPIPAGQISVSTVGITEGIYRLTKQVPETQITVTLNSPFPDERLSLIPATAFYPIDEIFTALDHHALTTGRRVFISYLMLQGNDTEHHASELVRLLRARPTTVQSLYHVNVLRFLTGGAQDEHFQQHGIKPSLPPQFRLFLEILEKGGLSFTARQSYESPA